MKSPSESCRSFWALFESPAAEAAKPRIKPLFWDLFRTNRPLRRDAFVYSIHWGHQMAFWAWKSVPGNQLCPRILFCGLAAPRGTHEVHPILDSLAWRLEHGRQGADCIARSGGLMKPCDVLTWLGARPEHENVWWLNPYDRDSPVWDLGQVVWTPAMAREMATVLVSIPLGQKLTFGDEAARELVCAAILELNSTAGAQWTLGELLAELGSPECIAAASRRHQCSSQCSISISTHENAGLELSETLSAKLRPFQPLAGLSGTVCFSLWLLAGHFPSSQWWRDGISSADSA